MIYYAILFFLFLVGIVSFWKKGVTHPVIQLLSVVFVYFIIKYFIYSFWDFRPMDKLTLEELALSGKYLVVFLLIAATTFTLFYLSRGRLPLPQLSFQERVPMGVIAVMAIGAALLFVVISGGPSMLLRPLEVRRILTREGMYYFSIFLEFAIHFYTLNLFMRKRYRALAVFSLFYLFFALISGRSALLVGYVFSFFVFAGVFYRRPLGKFVVVGVPILVTYVVLSGVYRNVSQERVLTTEEVKEAFKDYFEDSHAFEVILKGAVYRVDNLEGLTLLLRGYEQGDWEPTYGKHLSQVFIQWIPRSWMPDKPLNFTAEMTKKYRPSNSEQGVGNNFTALGEFVYNFGFLGVIVGGALVGILLYLAVQLWENAYLSFEYTVLFQMILLPYVGLGFLAGFGNDLALPCLIINIFLLLLFVKIRFKPSFQAVHI